MKNILEMRRLQENCPVMVADIPKEIIKEIDVWVSECRKIKNNPLADLKSHENIGYLLDGYKHNSYQTAVPFHLIKKSFWLAWVLRLSAKYWGMEKNHRHFKLRNYTGHFDAYDAWINFAYKGDRNPSHVHKGNLSGVIYYKNHNHPTYFDEYGCKYDGKNGTMIMFPSKVIHHVKEQTLNKERITFAFNVIECDAF